MRSKEVENGNARRLRNATRRKRNGEGSVAALAQEIIRGQPSVQALGAEQAMRERFGSENRESLEAGVEETAAAVAMERRSCIASAGCARRPRRSAATAGPSRIL